MKDLLKCLQFKGATWCNFIQLNPDLCEAKSIGSSFRIPGNRWMKWVQMDAPATMPLRTRPTRPAVVVLVVNLWWVIFGGDSWLFEKVMRIFRWLHVTTIILVILVHGNHPTVLWSFEFLHFGWPTMIQIAEPTRPGDATGLVATDGAAGHWGCDCWARKHWNQLVLHRPPLGRCRNQTGEMMRNVLSVLSWNVHEMFSYSVVMALGCFG